MKKIVLVALLCASAFIRSNATPILFEKYQDKRDTLFVLISEANYIYYYDNELQPDASNFMITSSGGLKSIVYRFREEAKEKGKLLTIILKVQQKSALNDSSKQAAEFLKTHTDFKQYGRLKEVEKELIRITEEAQKN